MTFILVVLLIQKHNKVNKKSPFKNKKLKGFYISKSKILHPYNFIDTCIFNSEVTYYNQDIKRGEENETSH